MGVQAPVLLVLLLALLASAKCADILFLSTVASPSHHIWNRAIMFSMLGKGHRVTLLTHDVEKEKHPNLTIYYLEGIYDKLHDAYDYNSFVKLPAKDQVPMVFDWFRFLSECDVETEGLKNLIRDTRGRKFDLIIWDINHGHFLYPLVEQLGSPPIVAVSPFGLQPYFHRFTGIDLNMAYIPFCALSYTDSMSFLQRAYNVFMNFYALYYESQIYLPAEIETSKKLFPEASMEGFKKIEKNISIFLGNLDPILDFPQALPPQVIQVGGLQATPSKPLPKDLQKFMDDAKDGVVVFSLGTNIRSDKLKLEHRQSFLRTFAKLKQRIVWKFEDPKQKEVPNNVIIRQWLPQNDLLGHPNVVLFIGHGGALSTQEAMYHGVPVVAMPFLADQRVISNKIVERKLGLKLTYETLSEKMIYDTLTEVINNPMYAKNMKNLSKRYRDQSETPLERAVFWTEYVLRNGGAQFLSVETKNMSFYQIYLLDVAAVLSIPVILAIVLLRCAWKLFKKISRADKVKKQ